MSRNSGAAAMVVLIALAACSPPTAQQTAQQTEGRVPPKSPLAASQVPVASFQELMKYIVDPTADDIWNSVSSTITKKGIEEHAPKTDAEWDALRRHAITLIEASNLLTVEGRPIVVGGATTSEVPEEWGAAEIDKAIKENRQQFLAHAGLFRQASQNVLAAIDAKDKLALLKTGGELDQACETCHLQFWYPKSVEKHRPAVAQK